MPVTPISYPIMSPIIVVSNSSPKKSEAEVLRENGGHMFFSVHMKHCEECRIENARRKEERDHEGFIFTMVVVGIVLGIVLLIQWDEIKRWFSDRIEAYKLRKYPLYRFEGEASTLIDPDEDSFHYINQVNYLTSGWVETFLKLPIVVHDENIKMSEHFKKHKAFLYHVRTQDNGCATYYLFKRWSIDGWKYKVLRLSISLHNRVHDKLKDL
jgi:hypothetical protein